MLEIAGVALIALVALIGFGVASNTGDTVLEGNIGDNVFELTVPPTLTWTLNPVQTMSEEIDLGITSNSFPWSVKVKSDSTDGKMREFDGTDYVTNLPRTLKNPMTVLYKTTDVTFSDQDQDLMSDEMAVGTDMPYKVKLSQPTDWTDVPLSSGHTYKIVLTFTGGIQI
jgi:hypothetical protein